MSISSRVGGGYKRVPSDPDCNGYAESRTAGLAGVSRGASARRNERACTVRDAPCPSSFARGGEDLACVLVGVRASPDGSNLVVLADQQRSWLSAAVVIRDPECARDSAVAVGDEVVL